ncbi:MAG: hypothetical protein M0Q91_16175 [Methanoregula sp.]|jgi:hypothetical protein|nr:hypothetical protein [Methanoregula sp.]
MVTEEDISLQKFSNYHSAYLLLLLSWVAIPPWLSINYESVSSLFSNSTKFTALQIQTIVIGVILLLAVYSLALTLVWNRCLETESALRSKCGCAAEPPTTSPSHPP